MSPFEVRERRDASLSHEHGRSDSGTIENRARIVANEALKRDVVLSMEISRKSEVAESDATSVPR